MESNHSYPESGYKTSDGTRRTFLDVGNGDLGKGLFVAQLQQCIGNQILNIDGHISDSPLCPEYSAQNVNRRLTILPQLSKYGSLNRPRPLVDNSGAIENGDS